MSEEERASDRWENEGGRSRVARASKTKLGPTEFPNYRITLLPPFEHKEPEDDDLGLPEDPTFSDYSKYLWTSHRRTGSVESPRRSRKIVDRKSKVG
jgi:hypothetical protein